MLTGSTGTRKHSRTCRRGAVLNNYELLQERRGVETLEIAPGVLPNSKSGAWARLVPGPVMSNDAYGRK